MKRVLLAVVAFAVTLAIVGGVALWLLQDANRFKPDLARMIGEVTGYEVDLAGELSWQLWPPITLAATNLGFRSAGDDYQIGSLNVKANALDLLRGGALTIEGLVIRNLVMTDRTLGDITEVPVLEVDRFEPGKPSGFSAAVDIPGGSTGDSRRRIQLDGVVTWLKDSDALEIGELDFATDGIHGNCAGKVYHLTREPLVATARTPDDLLPLETLRSMDWQMDCHLPRYVAGEGLIVEDLALTTANSEARSETTIRVPALLGGAAAVTVSVDTRSREPEWRVVPDIRDVNARDLMRLVGPDFDWTAALQVGGELRSRGNTPSALAGALQGTLELDSHHGSIDITAIKKSLLPAAALLGKAGALDHWPDRLGYQTFKGTWQVDEAGDSMHLALDNVLMAAQGDIDLLAQTLDLRGAITIRDDPAFATLRLNKALYDVPIPIVCSGTLAAPECRFDPSRAKDMLAAEARNRAGEKASELIDEKVSPEYRESANKLIKGLLDRKKD